MKEINGLEAYIMESRMQEFITEKGIEQEIQELYHQEKSEKAELLWCLCHGTGFSGLDQLEEKIFKYGSLLKQKDTLEREIFSHMYTILRQLEMNTEGSDSE